MVDTLRQAVRVTGEIALPTRGLGRRVVDKYLARRQYLLTHRPKF